MKNSCPAVVAAILAADSRPAILTIVAVERWSKVTCTQFLV